MVTQNRLEHLGEFRIIEFLQIMVVEPFAFFVGEFCAGA